MKLTIRGQVGTLVTAEVTAFLTRRLNSTKWSLDVKTACGLDLQLGWYDSNEEAEAGLDFVQKALNQGAKFIDFRTNTYQL